MRLRCNFEYGADRDECRAPFERKWYDRVRNCNALGRSRQPIQIDCGFIRIVRFPLQSVRLVVVYEQI